MTFAIYFNVTRSYDDEFFWGHIKEYVYRNPINNSEELEERIIKTIASIIPEMIQKPI